jgi:hypothetical protein
MPSHRSCRSGLPTKDADKGVARSRADRAIDAIRKRFGGQAVDYASASRARRSVPGPPQFV